MERYNLSEDEAIEKVNELKGKISSDLKSFVSRYGEEIGTKKYLEKAKKVSLANTLDGYIDRYGVEKGTEKYYKNNFEQSNKMIISHFRKKYDIDISDEEILLRHYNGKYTPLNKLKGSASKESLELLLPIWGFCLGMGLNVAFGYKDMEEFYVEADRKYYYDFVILDKKIIIEYDGYMYHYNEDEIGVNHFLIDKQSIIDNDEAKEKVALEKGYKLIRINKNSDLKNIINKLKELL